MKKYPYYIASRYEASILHKADKSFSSWLDCINNLKKKLEDFPHLRNNQYVIIEYTGQYESKITDIFNKDNWISVSSPEILMNLN